MNERIKQLAEQACAFADIQYNKQTRATFYTNKSVEEFFREKFAELIVQECLNQCYNRGMDDELYAGQLKAATYIEEYFGVEE